jgi:hypothetical protein
MAGCLLFTYVFLNSEIGIEIHLTVTIRIELKIQSQSHVILYLCNDTIQCMHLCLWIGFLCIICALRCLVKAKQCCLELQLYLQKDRECFAHFQLLVL